MFPTTMFIRYKFFLFCVTTSCWADPKYFLCNNLVSAFNESRDRNKAAEYFELFRAFLYVYRMCILSERVCQKKCNINGFPYTSYDVRICIFDSCHLPSFFALLKTVDYSCQLTVYIVRCQSTPTGIVNVH